jgi:uncharacterized membrane protein
MANPLDEDLRALRMQVAALTARVHQLEQRAGIEPTYQAPAAPPVAAAPPPPLPPVVSTRQPGVPAPPSVSRAPAAPPPPERDNLEAKIGKVWINRIAIIAILCGVAFFIQYAFQNNWIGPGGRVAIGIFAGIAVLLWSERFRSQGYLAFSYSFKALGIGILYFSLWGAGPQGYSLVPNQVVFAAMIAVTAAAITLALTQNAEILAFYAILGGFATPILMSTKENHEVALFSYLALLDLALLIVVAFKPWRRLMWACFLGTVILFSAWFLEWYTPSQRNVTVFFAALFFAIFAAIPLVTPLEKSRWHKGISTTLILLPMFNAAFFFLALFAMYGQEKTTLTWYALALAGVYLTMSSLFRQRANADPDTLKLINMLHVAVAIAFITIAIPLKLDAHWITIGWLIESAVLLFVGVRTNTSFLRYFAGIALALGVLRLLITDSDHIQNTLIFNTRFATYVVAIAIMGAILYFGERVASNREMTAIKLAGVALNLLALVALTLEAHDYFYRAIQASLDNRGFPTPMTSDLRLAWAFSYSAIWLIYGTSLMAFGFWKRDAFVRWQALVLMAFTIGKVFIYDTWSLDKVYRILSFIALGVVLMAISFIYQRDWLKLSPRPSENTVKGTSA